jgi:hypothetical protein
MAPTNEKRSRRVQPTVTSLGDLINAIYEALSGSAESRIRQTAWVLTSTSLARRVSRPIRLTT